MPVRISVSTSGRSRRVSCLIKIPSRWFSRKTSSMIASFVFAAGVGTAGLGAAAVRRRITRKRAVPTTAAKSGMSHQKLDNARPAGGAAAVENWYVKGLRIWLQARSYDVVERHTVLVVYD